MSGFLSELGKKVAERWLTLLVLPGLFYLTCLAIALTLRHPRALEPGPLRDAVNRLAVQPVAGSPGVLLLTATAILAAAAAAGFAAGGLGRLTERAWNAEGHRWPARLLTRRRQQRWKGADAEVQARIAAAVRARTGPSAAGPAVPAMAVVSAAPDMPAVPAMPAALAVPAMPAAPGKPVVPAGPVSGVAAAIAAREAIGLIPPQRPTWIGDRLRAGDQRIHTAYDLDLSSAWPRLWLVVPEAARTELTAARDAYTAAARLTGWAMLYLLPALWWWPALPVAAAIAVTAWVRARTATAALAELIEATVDLYGRDLATQLGIPTDGPLSREMGLAITTTLRKDPETHHPVA